MTIIRRADTKPTEHALQAPWLESVMVPAGSTLPFVSGQVSPVVDDSFAIEDRRAYGDMEVQTEGVLQRLDAKLRAASFTLDDVVKLTAFLVGQPELEGHLELEGFGRGYRQHFGTAGQPRLHARTRIQVASLMNPAWLDEIEAVAAAAGRESSLAENISHGDQERS